LAQPGDILITVKGSGVGKTNVLVDQPTAISRQLMAIRVTGADPEFVNVVLKRAAEYFQNAKTGIAIPGIGRREVLGLPVVLPPLVEQKRIVAKVDELMALCDRLEAQQQERETRHAALARASLARFADAPIPANLNLLFHSSFPISPSDLRKSILTLAVQGKLVPQDPKDETAEELLNNINRERLAAVKVRRISPMKPLPPVEEGEIAYDLRPGRALARLIELVMEIQTGPFGSSLHQRDYQVGGTPVINPASLKDGKIVPIESMAIGPDTLNRLEVFRLNEGDIVMARRGEMGRCAIVTKAEHGWLCGTGSLVLRMPTGMYAPFLALLIGAPEAREYLGGASVGTTMQNLNQGILAKMPVGVPPLAEQRRIVAKVSELMALVDELETQLAASRAAGEKLLTALVAELTGANS
jgi:type I restriction enzyme S subunit